MTTELVFTDRYGALGLPQPDPATMCQGDCEGTGYVPIKRDDPSPVYQALWDEAEAKEATDDGWHFVCCPDCNGTRLRKQ